MGASSFHRAMAILGLDSPLKQCVFATYITLWVTCHMLVYASRQSGAPTYNATSVVLLTELIKLIMALSLYRLNDGSCTQLLRQISGSKQLLLRYLIPAQLYCLYNNLVYLNLEVHQVIVQAVELCRKIIHINNKNF